MLKATLCQQIYIETGRQIIEILFLWFCFKYSNLIYEFSEYVSKAL